MLRAIAELEGRKLSDFTSLELGSEAVCLRYRVSTKGVPPEIRRKHRLIGTIFFIRGRAPMSTVVHELAHATVGWAKRTKVDPLHQTSRYASCPEERFARTLQFMVEQFYEHAPRALGNAA
jgi:hypothetical protein